MKIELEPPKIQIKLLTNLFPEQVQNYKKPKNYQ